MLLLAVVRGVILFFHRDNMLRFELMNSALLIRSLMLFPCSTVYPTPDRGPFPSWFSLSAFLHELHFHHDSCLASFGMTHIAISLNFYRIFFLFFFFSIVWLKVSVIVSQGGFKLTALSLSILFCVFRWCQRDLWPLVGLSASGTYTQSAVMTDRELVYEGRP